MSIKMIDFEFTEDITVVNQAQYDEHLKLYKGYVDKYNEIEEKLASDADRKNANATYSTYRGLKRGETFALNGVILHELYFENIGGKTIEPSDVLEMISKNFGSFKKWKEDFIAAAMASRGWVLLAYEQRTKSFLNISLDAHDVGNIVLAYPILVIDMYEHAYFLDYGTEKGMYINEFLSNINWDVVQCRMNKLYLTKEEEE